LDKALDIVTGMSLPLALIAIGASFSPQKLRGELTKAFFSTGIKIIWMPVLTAVILLLLGVEGMELAVGVLLAGTPTATSAYIMAQQLKSDAELSGAIIMMSTVLSVFTYSFFLFVLKTWGI
jgi:predicted permease